MHRETCTVLMGCSKGSAVRLAPSSLLCAQTGRAGQWLRAGPGLRAWAWDCARGSAGPFAGSGNPFLRSWALLVAVWAACLDYHQWG